MFSVIGQTSTFGFVMDSNTPYITKLSRLWSRLRKSIKRLFSVFNKDHANFFFSLGAIIISLVSAGYTWWDATVDIADKQYLFWDKINSSYKIQEHILQKLYPVLLAKADKAIYIRSYIHGDTLSCQAFAENSRQSNTRKITPYLQGTTSTQVTKYEDDEKSSLQTTTLELRYLATSLHPKGWNEFLANTAYSDMRWNRLSWDTMQLSFFPAVWAWNCAPSKPHIKINQIHINQKSVRRLRSDIKTVYRWLPLIEEGQTPNLMAITYLERRNTLSADSAHSNIQEFHGTQPVSIMNDAVSKILYIASEASENHKSSNK